MENKIEIGHGGNNILIGSDGTIYVRDLDIATINLPEGSDITFINENKDPEKIEIDKQS